MCVYVFTEDIYVCVSYIQNTVIYIERERATLACIILFDAATLVHP